MGDLPKLSVRFRAARASHHRTRPRGCLAILHSELSAVRSGRGRHRRDVDGNRFLDSTPHRVVATALPSASGEAIRKQRRG